MARTSCPSGGFGPVAAMRYRASVERLERRVARLEGADVVPLLNLVRALRDKSEALEGVAQRRQDQFYERRTAALTTGRFR